MNKQTMRFILKVIAYSVCHVVSTLVYPVLRFVNIVCRDNKLRVLLYHRVCEMPSAKWIEYQNVLPASFAVQMRLLAECKYNVLTAKEVIEHLQSRRPFSRKAVCITFDDGYLNNYTYVFSELRRHGHHGSFYVVTDYMDTNKAFDWVKQDQPAALAGARDIEVWQPLRWAQIQEMAKCGMEVGSHSCTHTNFLSLQPDDRRAEIERSRRELKAHVDDGGETFACPFGLFGQAAEELKLELQTAGYMGAFLGRMGAVNGKSDLFDLPRFSIHERDSLATLQRKIDGAYDWLAWFQPLWVWLVGGQKVKRGLNARPDLINEVTNG